NLSLSEEETAILEKWVKQGAVYEKHWSFVAPEKRELPELDDPDWPINEIDHFVLDRMTREGLSPNEPASKMHLLKRLSLDLNGLPPTLEMMENYSGDQSTNAYEKMVDRLLDQPSFGEKLAVLWLDIARYSDSYGYQDDNVRTQWPYRDWVIHAFNTNLPSARFIT